MSDTLESFTPARTRAHAYLFAHVLRALFQVNRVAMCDRWGHMHIELTNGLGPLICGAPSVMEAITSICARWSLVPHGKWGALRIVMPRAIAEAWAFTTEDAGATGEGDSATLDDPNFVM